MNTQQHAHPVSVQVQQKRLLALQLREGGAKYREIAEQLQVTTSYAHELVMKAMDDLNDTVAETAERMRQLELNRLDKMWMDLSTRKDATSPRTIDTKLRIMERRAKLLGLDAPMQLGGPGGGPIPFQSTDPREAVRTKVAAITARIGGGASLEEAVEYAVGVVQNDPAAAPEDGPAPETQNGDGTTP